MNRQEEIIKATKEFYPIPDTECLAKDAFLVGANWVDNHPIISKKVLESIFEYIGIFNHYSYFTEELYRKLKGRKDVDEAEVKCAFLHSLLYSKFHLNTVPSGCGWFCILDQSKESTALVKEYLNSYKDIFNDFNKWCLEQR